MCLFSVNIVFYSIVPKKILYIKRMLNSIQKSYCSSSFLLLLKYKTILSGDAFWWPWSTFTFSHLADAPERLPPNTGTFPPEASRVKCLAQGHNVILAQRGIDPATFWLLARLPHRSAIWLPIYIYKSVTLSHVTSLKQQHQSGCRYVVREAVTPVRKGQQKKASGEPLSLTPRCQSEGGQHPERCGHAKDHSHGCSNQTFCLSEGIHQWSTGAVWQAGRAWACVRAALCS